MPTLIHFLKVLFRANGNLYRKYVIPNFIVLNYLWAAKLSLTTGCIGSWRCLQWQYRAIRAFQRPATIPGGTCERRVRLEDISNKLLISLTTY